MPCEDKGVGIKAEELKLVFEKYYRSARVGKIKGAGVGLFLVKKIIDLHQGSITLVSKSSKGTKVTIMLPL